METITIAKEELRVLEETNEKLKAEVDFLRNTKRAFSNCCLTTSSNTTS